MRSIAPRPSSSQDNAARDVWAKTEARPWPGRHSLSRGERNRPAPSDRRAASWDQAAPSARHRGTRSGSASILVVEDEESYQEALMAGLSREGFDVELASDGAEALDRFIDHRPDLVLL